MSSVKVKDDKAASLEQLSSFDPRTVWPSESNDFTPWLAEEKNLELLGIELGLDLELVGREYPVGPYWADVLAKDTVNDRNVVIENQLEKTDHDHLGKAMTYGAILGASVVVWIAKEFTDEHRKTLDWLNDHTDEDLDFFGVVIEIWRIGESPPAPRFNIVSRPSAMLKQARGSVSEGVVSDTKQLQLEFWLVLRDQLKAANVVSSLQTPRLQNWYNIVLGRSGFHVQASLNTITNRFAVRIYLKHKVAEAAFSKLELQKDAIHEEMGMELDWNPRPEKFDGRPYDKTILIDRSAILAKRDEWPEYLDWMVNTIAAIQKAFRPRVKAIDLTPSRAEEAED